jgi:hypothetical protein
VVVCLGVVVLVIAVLALREPNGHVAAAQTTRTGASNVADHSATQSRTPGNAHTPPRTSGAASSPANTKLPLVVLNNTTVGGLASRAADRFRAGGWSVTSVGNMTNNILSTCAYYDPSTAGAKEAAQALQAQFPTIRRVEPRFPELPAGPVVVVLTPDYSAT